MTTPALGKICSEHLGRNLEGQVGSLAITLLGGAAVIGFSARPWVALVAVGVGALWWVVTAAWTPAKVVLHEDGITVHRRFRAPRSLAFAECRYVFHDWGVTNTLAGTVVTDYALKLVDDRRHMIRLRPRSLSESGLLFTRIERLLVYPRNQELRAAFDAGNEVQFGPISVSERGIRIGGRMATWADVRAFELSPKLLIVRFHRGFRRIAQLGQVPFPLALVSILRARGVPMKLFEGFRAT